MEEVGAQVATPIFLHQSLSGRFYDAPAGMARKKRDLPYQAPSHQQHPAVSQQPRFGNPGVNNSWNPNVWDWDTVRFVAKPLDTEMMTAAPSEPPGPKRKEEASAGVAKSTAVVVVDDGDDDERLQLNLGGGLATVEEPAMSSRPNKRVRSGSPGNNGGSYPMCQVDSCKEDLSNAKDYHRRHKVCESHSKSTRALVAKQMQRFCQQCSRFHPLPEFDEGKRSCRRRLAGHNRRRRKTQPEDVTSRLTVPGDANNKSGESLDIVNLLAAIARQQGKNDVRNTNCSPVVDREQILQILSKINSMPLPADLAAKLPSLGSLNWKATDLLSLDLQNKLNGKTSASTMDLITVLSATLAASSSDTLAMLSQKSSQSSDSEKTRLTSSDQAAGPNFQKRSPQEFHSAGGERSSTSYQSPTEDSDCQVQETRVKLPLQLFSSSPEDDSPPKLASSQKYFSSDSSNRTEERSPSSSPPVMQTLFPMKSMAETVKSEKLSTSKEFNMNLDSSRDGGSNLPFDLFGGSNRGAAVSSSIQNFPHQAGYISSGSDHSPSSLNSDPQDRTGRILFKLFDKDPSQLPGTLRQQVYNWLSSSPSQMESYIRPGCVVLSVYVSMSFAAWEQLEENLVQRVSSLVHSSDSDFWRSGRFLVNTGRQLASHKDGKIRLCKAWRTYNSPELISVSPLAVVGGQEISLSIRGRNLTNLGTKIHCTYMGGYSSKEVGTTNRGTAYDEINLGRFQICDASPGVLGRCFIEVENGFKGNSFPVIIADATICRELKLIESEFDAETKICGATSEDESNDSGRPRSREEVLHFLNELGWLFQRKRHSSMFKGSDYSLGRFKFLLTFTVERDSCILVKTLLDILVNLEGDGLSRESLGMLSDIQLLNRAVKRRCRKMIDLLINYSVTSSDKRYIFPPNLAGPGGLTPLHLAASMSNSDDMVDALTNDPEEIGLNCWTSLLDATGQSPYAYAMMRSNYSYNNLVARKLTDRKNSQVTLTIGSEIEQTHMAMELERRTGIQFRQGSRSCAKCAVAATKYIRRVPGAQGLLQRPFIHSMLAIAAVCVCVCLFLRGAPYIGSVAPFKWENLDFGTI